MACPADRVRTRRSAGAADAVAARRLLLARLTGGEHDRADPATFEVLLLLLSDDFLCRERWERFVGQVHFELGNRQEQWLWRADLGFFHIAFALGNDVSQQFTANGGFDRAVEIDRWKVERSRYDIARLIGQGLGKEILPQVTDAAQCLGVS